VTKNYKLSNKDVPAKLDANYTQIVPLNIFQTMKSDTLSEGMYNARKTWIYMNPEYNYHYYTDEDARNFIKNNFDRGVLEAYDKLVPGAYKADLWRYCILYIKGGVYIDIPTLCKVPLREIIPKDVDFVSARDYWPFGVYNCFMASTPKHPFLKKAIEESVKNIQNNYYGKTNLDITGPHLLGKAMNMVLGRKHEDHFKLGMSDINGRKFLLLEHIPKTREILNKDGVCVVKTRYAETYFDDLFTHIGGKNQKYGELWIDRKVYY
jgi:mannosyltransferase OCH1-like enzyme